MLATVFSGPRDGGRAPGSPARLVPVMTSTFFCGWKACTGPRPCHCGRTPGKRRLLQMMLAGTGPSTTYDLAERVGPATFQTVWGVDKGKACPSGLAGTQQLDVEATQCEEPRFMSLLIESVGTAFEKL